MGKKDKSSNGGLGRALVRQHNQMVQQSKEKGVALRDLQRRQKPVLESVTEVSDIDAILGQAAAPEEAVHGSLAAGSGKLPSVPITLDTSSRAGDMLVMTAEERRRQQEEEALHASSLRVPRRPPWTAKMSPEELDANEKQAFLAWRRSLARSLLDGLDP